jgi:phage terminase large subunit-like protein
MPVRCTAQSLFGPVFGGAMVESTIRTASRTAPVKLLNASRGKVQRAEPVAALYAQGKVRHVGHFAELER